MQVEKVNGAVNKYTISLTYAIRAGDDPNLIDKVLASAQDRSIKISYGDYSLPSFIFKEEEAMIQSVKQSISMNSSQISYTLNCVSTSDVANAGSITFPPINNRKPSDVIKELFSKPEYGLLDLFPGMRMLNSPTHANLIPSDDKPTFLR